MPARESRDKDNDEEGESFCLAAEGDDDFARGRQHQEMVLAKKENQVLHETLGFWLLFVVLPVAWVSAHLLGLLWEGSFTTPCLFVTF